MLQPFLTSIQPDCILPGQATHPVILFRLVFICKMALSHIIDFKLVADPLGFPTFLLWIEITILIQNAIVSATLLYFAAVLAFDAPIMVTPGTAPASVMAGVSSMMLTLYSFA